MKKGIFAIVLAVVLLTGGISLVTVCQAQAQDKIILKLASPYPLSHLMTVNGVMLSDLVKKASNGSVDIQVFPSEQLAKARETHEAVSMGVIDMGIVASPYFAGRLPIMGIDHMPWLFPSWAACKAAHLGGLDEVLHEALKKAFNIKSLFTYAAGGTELWTVKKPVRKPEDIKGMLVRGAGGSLTEMVKAMGATPVTLTGPEVFTALQRGTVDGVTQSMLSLHGGKYWEVCKYGTKFSRPLEPGADNLCINQDKWDKLPPSVQKIISEASTKVQDWSFVRSAEIQEEDWKDSEKNGLTIIRPTPAEEAAFETRMKTVWDWYIGQTGDQGRKLIEIAKKFR